MIGWQAHVDAAHRRREVAGWTAATAFVVGTVAAGAALAMIYDPAGTDGAETVIMMDLPPMPEAQAVAEVPEAAPEVPTEEPEQELPEPEPEQPPDLPEPVAEAPPDILPPPDMPPPVEQAEVALPDTTPPPPPRMEEPPPEKPVEKVEKKPEPERPRRTAREQAPERTQAQQGQVGSTAARGTATANEIERWQGRVQAQLARHMQRRRFAPGTVVLQVSLAPSGQVTGISVVSASGAAGLEGTILAHARGLGRVAAPPAGAPTTLRVPVQVR